METWLRRPQCYGQCEIHMQNSDIFTTGTSWFCCKCLHVSRSTHAGRCPLFLLVVLLFLNKVWHWSVAIKPCQCSVSLIFQHIQGKFHNHPEKSIKQCFFRVLCDDKNIAFLQWTLWPSGTCRKQCIAFASGGGTPQLPVNSISVKDPDKTENTQSQQL